MILDLNQDLSMMHATQAGPHAAIAQQTIRSGRDTGGTAARRQTTLRPRIHEQKKIESFERINSIRKTNGNFDSCNSCKRLGTSRLHELHESKFPFVSRIEFIRSKLSNFSAHVYGVSELGRGRRPGHERPTPPPARVPGNHQHWVNGPGEPPLRAADLAMPHCDLVHYRR